MKFKKHPPFNQEFLHTIERLRIYQDKNFEDISVLIDIGVSDGRFIQASHELFPTISRVIGVDPIDEYSHLTEFEYIKALIGSKCNEVPFSVSEDLFTSSKLYGDERTINAKQMRMDCLLDELNIDKNQSFFVKIDTQGSDLECLQSFGTYIKCIKMALVEIQMRPYSEGMHFFSQSVLEISRMGFEVIEVLNPLFRNFDGSLGQLDLLIVPKSSKILESTKW